MHRTGRRVAAPRVVCQIANFGDNCATVRSPKGLLRESANRAICPRMYMPCRASGLQTKKTGAGTKVP